jgi:hypothetical protein
MCDLGDADVGIGQQRFGSLDVIVGEFRRPTSGAAKPTGGGEARFGRAKATFKDWSCHAGPMVRIRLPPAESQAKSLASARHKIQAQSNAPSTPRFRRSRGVDG